MDGVDQLNNILIIGMTNRFDMIDEALLRPGRLEVHMEINLPDQSGRLQILKIHTQKMRDNNIMGQDVDLNELAALTKNYSGAEIAGLIKSATSFAFNRHTKAGTVAEFKPDAGDMKVNRADFMMALDETHPAFGVSEEELAALVQGNLIMYSKHINVSPFDSNADKRASLKPRNCMWSRFAPVTGLDCSVCYCMGQQAAVKPHWQLKLQWNPSFLMSNSSHLNLSSV